LSDVVGAFQLIDPPQCEVDDFGGQSERSNVRQEEAMRLNNPLDYSLPPPGTPEAIELGCTCRVIGHDSKLEEAAPSGMLTASDTSCPVHGNAAQLEEHE
jgi:hypothetical protein